MRIIIPTNTAETIRRRTRVFIPLKRIAVHPRRDYRVAMGELRLYAIGVDEVAAMFGAPDDLAAQLRDRVTKRLAGQQPQRPPGLLSKLGPIFKRPPGEPAIDPDDPIPDDLDRLVSGSYVPAERSVATWRLLELLIKEIGWGWTGMSLSGEELDRLDFALARGGVPSSGGLRHLMNTAIQLPIVPPQGLLVGHQPGAQALWMAGSYRNAVPEIESEQHRDQIGALAGWLNGFTGWTEAAQDRVRPAPDLIGFWGVS